jgi:hypothetical protein
MIRYALNCTSDHSFESWFQSAQAFDGLLRAGLVTCPTCGVATVTKSLMAPAVSQGRAAVPSLRKPANDQEAALAALRAEVEAKAEYVGVDFATEARAMHDGDAPERSIYGEARPEDAIKLLKDGVPIAPLPFMPIRKAN